MNNEEKAKELSFEYKKYTKINAINLHLENVSKEDIVEQSVRAAAFEMAQWKDEQLKETLKKKMDFFYPPIDDYNEGKLAVLKDLYQELFNEYYI